MGVYVVIIQSHSSLYWFGWAAQAFLPVAFLGRIVWNKWRQWQWNDNGVMKMPWSESIPSNFCSLFPSNLFATAFLEFILMPSKGCILPSFLPHWHLFFNLGLLLVRACIYPHPNLVCRNRLVFAMPLPVFSYLYLALLRLGLHHSVLPLGVPFARTLLCAVLSILVWKWNVWEIEAVSGANSNCYFFSLTWWPVYSSSIQDVFIQSVTTTVFPPPDI